MLVQRPLRADPTAAQKAPGLGIEGVERRVIIGRRGGARLIFQDALQLPAQRIAEHLLQLIRPHPRRLAIGHAHPLDRHVQAIGHTPRIFIISRSKGKAQGHVRARHRDLAPPMIAAATQPQVP